ncbi:MAG: c-type cytochrome [Acidimicrobiia bacterium]|nr:c-type cytochrome [Acidimicrobiia bacterium]MDH3397218.1 c-type cytochrome [Acidimicrobiia bacterium]
MTDYLSAATEAAGVPEALIRRAAEARAAADGLSVDDILAAWAGGTAAPAAAPSPEPPPATETPALPIEETTPAVVPVESPQLTPAPAPSPGPMVIPARPVPETVDIDQARQWESVVTVATAGLKERTTTRVPSWLTAAFVILPLVGLLYLLQLSGGPDCGSSGVLAVDRVTGEVVNCDGSPFEGRGAPGSGSTDFLARGQALYADAQVACNGCHGENGQGGVGPTFAGGAVLATFPSCADHVQWVQLGSAGWQAQVGPEYGAQGKISQGGMPNFGDSLSDEDLRSVITFERVRFGGANLEETLADCGLVIPEPPAGESGTGTTETTGETTVTTGASG